MCEVVDELVKGLTSEEFQGKLVVILAGYPHDIEEMLAVNPGLKSRFTERLQFEDIDAGSVVELLIKKMTGKKLFVADQDRKGLVALAERLVKSSEFANGRDVETWAKYTYQEISKMQSCNQDSSFPQIRTNATLSDFESALTRLVESRSQIVKKDIQKIENERVIAGQPLFAPLQQPLREASAQDIPSPSPSSSTVLITTHEAESSPDYLFNEAVNSEGKPDLNKDKAPFANIDKRVLSTIQRFLIDVNLNTEEGVLSFVRLSLSDPKILLLIEKIATEHGLTKSFIESELKRWQDAQKCLRQLLDKELKSQSKSKKMQAIWRCQVCGRADKPWIACWAAPFIVRYEHVDT